MPSPTTLKFTLELLTPAVLGGAHPRQCDPYMPLRPPSLRGLWRYWFRAAAASHLWPEHNQEKEMVQALLEAESNLFGDTKRRSRFALLPPEAPEPTRLTPPDNGGRRYLGYGLFEDKGRPSECLPEGREVTVECSFRHARDTDLDVLIATVWLWSNFGGLGARSRRGWGSLRLKAIAGPPDHTRPWDPLIALAPTPQAHLTLLNDGIARVLDTFKEYLRVEGIGRQFLSNSARGPHQSIRTLEGIASLQSLKHTFASSAEALEHAGLLFRNFRSTLERSRHGHAPLPDYFAVKSALQPPNGPPRTVERAAFGLPLNFFFRSLNGKKTSFLPKPRGPADQSNRDRRPQPREDKDLDRLASPLLFRVFALGGKRFGVALINLAGKPEAPPLQGCTLKSKEIRGPINPPSSALILTFIDWAIQQPLSPAGPPRNRNRNRR